MGSATTEAAERARELGRLRSRRYYRRHRRRILRRKAIFYAEHREALKLRRVTA